MKIALLLVASGLMAAADAEPPSVPRPTIRAGDTWVFDQTEQRGATGFGEQRVNLTVERVEGDTMLVGVKRDGAPTAYEDHVVGSDWSQRHVVDGQETSTTRPLTFPLAVGRSWTVDFGDTTRRGAQISLHVHLSRDQDRGDRRQRRRGRDAQHRRRRRGGVAAGWIDLHPQPAGRHSREVRPGSRRDLLCSRDQQLGEERRRTV